MGWLEIKVRVGSEDAATAVGALFDRYGRGGAVYEQIYADGPDVPQGTAPPVTVKTYLSTTEGYQQQLQALQKEILRVGEAHPCAPVEIKELADEDWATAWRAFFRPQRIGKRFVVKLPDQSYPVAEDQLLIHLQPGMAFGTGLHATTRMCLVCLEELVRPGHHLLDLGTGSGILAIGAAKLGADHVLALDNDPIAVAVARENVSLNNLENVIDVTEGSLDHLTSKDLHRFDGIVLNIIAEVIVEMMEQGLTSFLKPRGWLLASGILAQAQRQVIAHFEGRGLLTVQRFQQEEWVTLYGRKTVSDTPARPILEGA
ncbi:MAG TPA: 50S ribosomal protein L11 methyltransferase [Anaerolineae bacterium]|nr:50S ribosomal protein L11 methyltransferase [Anaerolineae bacterium]